MRVGEGGVWGGCGCECECVDINVGDVAEMHGVKMRKVGKQKLLR